MRGVLRGRGAVGVERGDAADGGGAERVRRGGVDDLRSGGGREGGVGVRGGEDGCCAAVGVG